MTNCVIFCCQLLALTRSRLHAQGEAHYRGHPSAGGSRSSRASRVAVRCGRSPGCALRTMHLPAVLLMDWNIMTGTLHV